MFATPSPVPTGLHLRTAPKVLLHEHLDGGLRPETLFDLCRARAVEIPARDAASLAQWMHANADSGSLVRYLRGFAITCAAMATPEACERIAFEAAEDAREDGCVLAEFRMAPLLLEEYGMSGEAVMEALLAGLARSSLACGLIVCGMRPEPPERTLHAARLAARYRDGGPWSCSPTTTRLMSGVTLTAELEALHARTGLTRAQLASLMRAAVGASFMPRAERAAATAQVESGWSSSILSPLNGDPRLS